MVTFLKLAEAFLRSAPKVQNRREQVNSPSFADLESIQGNMSANLLCDHHTATTSPAAVSVSPTLPFVTTLMIEHQTDSAVIHQCT